MVEVQFYNHGSRLDRLACRIDFGPDCWEWSGSVQPNGYGKLGRDYAHRAMWEEVVGNIPDGLQIDHLCRNRSCVNPDHLEPVTAPENMARGETTVAQTHCKNGHPLTDGNVYVVDSPDYTRRKCKPCHLETMRRYRERRDSEAN